MTTRIAIEDVGPAPEGGYPAKAVVGEHVSVRATVWREGHDAVGATVVWSGPDGAGERHTRMASDGAGLDRWKATIVPDAPGLWTFRLDAWDDPWTTWRNAVGAKVAAGCDPSELAVDLEVGALLLERAADRPEGRAHRDVLRGAATALRRGDVLLAERLQPVSAAEVEEAMTRHPVRDLVTRGETHQIQVERTRASFGSWYEFFPRSTGGLDADGEPAHGTLRTARAELDRVAAMGFDVVYLPPIHPIGEVNRKGRNNSEVALPGDVGSPWAIGSADGGHDAVHPALGTLADFDAFVARATELGLEVALDLALQCAPDHPWVSRHPEWFTTRPDGSIACAENPPKRYQDIYPLHFDTDPDGLYAEVLRVVAHWLDHGVRIFRVDNPHTKPPNFWHWLIRRVKELAPDAVFLSEAFTRPARLYGLARRGFSQSYTYFTWRTTKAELVAFGAELVERADECRPNLFVNTPDILPGHLQGGEPAVFALRAALAATMSPAWGVYSGYELYEHEPLRPGGDEYLDSEKYQLRYRDFAAADAGGRSLTPWLTRLNEIRRAHPALHQLRTLHFHDTDNDMLIAYSKTDPATEDAVLTVVNLDPHNAVEGTVRWDLAQLGLTGARFTVLDEVSGEFFEWGEANYVKLDPQRAVAHIATVVRRWDS